MQTLKNAAFLGLAAGDRTLFAPVAQPLDAGVAAAYGPLAGVAQVGYPEISAQPLAYGQPLEYVRAPAPESSQFWLWAGAGALAAAGAAAALKGQATAVAALDEEDLETGVRVATLGVGGAEKNRVRAGGKREREGWSLTSFLMGGRKSFRGDSFGELELLSGATKPGSDDAEVLEGRFKIGYDTRGRSVARKATQQAAKKAPVTFRPKVKTNQLYGYGITTGPKKTTRGKK